MKVLVINSGSSSLKYQLIDANNEKVLAKGLCDRIGIGQSFIKNTGIDNETKIKEKEMGNHKVAIVEVLDTLVEGGKGVLSSMDEIHAVGHRVVHGGEKFHDSVIIDDDVMETIQECVELAPLHNPANIVGIEACKQVLPHKPMVAVFDTAFHQSIPKHAYLYALPYEMYEKYGIRKYGFHGTSHKYVAQRAAKLLGKSFEDMKVITCHLGNGASICAIKNGKSVDTSMGFTPLAGLAMGTRSGTVDPAVIAYIMSKEKMGIDEVNEYLNKKSGILGISGVSSDFRDVMAAAGEGNKRAELAIEIFCYRVKNYISEYIGVLNGTDAVVFTAGVGENNNIIRRIVVANMENLGISIDNRLNDKAVGMEMDVSNPGAKVKTLVIPTNEELAIARETLKLLR